MTTAALVRSIRREFEERTVDRALLARLYQAYADVEDIQTFIAHAIDLFPTGNCGVASLYLQHKLGCGAVARGRYGDHEHTVLFLTPETIVDITADQFGGPPIYRGPVRKPWAFVFPKNVRTGHVLAP